MSNRYAFRKSYMKNVIVHLMALKNIDEEAATRMLLKYYRPMYRSWGLELNTEHFAEKLLSIDGIIQKVLNSPPASNDCVRWVLPPKYKTLTINIDKRLYRKAKSFALLHDKELSAVIEIALQRLIKSYDDDTGSRSKQ